MNFLSHSTLGPITSSINFELNPIILDLVQIMKDINELRRSARGAITNDFTLAVKLIINLILKNPQMWIICLAPAFMPYLLLDPSTHTIVLCCPHDVICHRAVFNDPLPRRLGHVAPLADQHPRGHAHH